MAKTTFVNGNPAQGILGTVVTAEFLNAVNKHHHTGRDVDGEGALPYAADTGTADAYAIALDPALSGYVTGMPIFFKAANTNTGASTLDINGLGTKSIKKSTDVALAAGDIAAGQVICVVYDGANFQIIGPLVVPAQSNTGEIRQTVLSARLSSGLPAFIIDPDDGLQVLIDTDDGAAPIIISFSAGYDVNGPVGYVGVIDSDTLISSLEDNSTNFLFAERNTETGALTLGKVSVAPVYSRTAPSHAANQYWFSLVEMKMYLSNGASVWTEKQVVFLGEAITASGQVTSVVNYALNGEYRKRQALAAASTPTIFAHNIGVQPDIASIKLICTATDLDYPIGATLANVKVVDSGGNTATLTLGHTDRNIIWYGYPHLINGSHASTTVITGSITQAKWDVEISCKRGW